MKKDFFVLLLVIGYLLLVISCALADGLAIDPSQSILGARQIALGRAGVALDGDPWSLFMNPSGLADIKYPKISATSRKIFFDETQYICLGGAYPNPWGTLGFGIIGTGITNSYQTRRDSETDRITINPSKEAIGNTSNVFLLSYSKTVQKKLSLGTNLKFYDQGFNGGSTAHATGYGLDIGAMYNFLPYFNVGANWQNFLSSGLKWTGGAGATDTLPGLLKIGGALNILGNEGASLKKNEQKLDGFLDVDIQRSACHLGFEWLPMKNLVLRAGYDSNLGISYGVGFTNWGFRFDYAYALSPFGAGDNPHYFTLNYVGDLVKNVSRKLLNEKIALKLYSMKDREITTRESVSVKGLAVYDKTFDEVTSWIVPSISQKDDHRIVTEEANLVNFKINNRALNVKGSFETEEKLWIGRNVFFIQGEIPGKGVTYEAFKVLRPSPFTDVKENFWAFRPIALISSLEIIKGYPDGSFKPNGKVSRAELTAILARIKNVSMEALSAKEAKKILSRSEAINLITRQLEAPPVSSAEAAIAKKQFTRAEAATLLLRTKTIEKKIERFWETGLISEEVKVQPATKEASAPLPNSPATEKSKKQ